MTAQDQNNYRLIVENMIDGYAYFQLVFNEQRVPVDAIYLEVNKCFEEIVGLKREDMIGRKVSELFERFGKSVIFPMQPYGKEVNGDTASRREYYSEILHKWYSISMFAMENDHFAATFHDITDIKNSQEVLRRQGEKERSILENIPEKIFVLDRDGVIVEFKGLEDDDLYVPARDFLGKRMVDVLPRDIAFDIHSHIQEAHESGEIITFEYGMRIKGKEKNFEAKIVAYEKDETLVIVRNITRRRVMEKALRKREAYYRSIVNSIDDVLFTINSNQRIMDVFGQRFKKSGLKRKSFIGKTPRDIFHDEEIKIYDEISKKVLTGEHGECEWSFVKDEKAVEFHTSLSPLRDSNQKIVGLVGVAHDVTRIKEMEKQLKEAQERFVEAQHIASIGNWEWDAKSDKSYWSNEIFRIFGLVPQNFYPTRGDFLRSVHPKDQEMVKKIQDDVFKRKETQYSMEYRIIRGCEEAWLFEKCRVEYDEKGEVKRIYGITQDITAQKVTSEMLRESQERWKFALEGSGDGIWDWNIQTNEIIFSSRWAEMLGYKEDEIERNYNGWLKLLHPDDMERITNDLTKCLKGKFPSYVTEQRLRCKDGSYKWVLDRGKVISWSDDGKPLRMVGTHTDISSHKQAEEELIRAKEYAESVSQMKDLFLSNVSHELRTPLNVILGSLQLFSLFAGEETIPAKYQRNVKYINIMKRNCYRLLRMLNNLIDIAKVDSGFLILRKGNHDIIGIIRDIVFSIKEYTDEKGIVLTFAADIEKKILACDPDQIERIMLNLLSNAIKYTKDTIDIRIRDMGDSIIISVEDNGTGIPKEKLTNIFDRFVQVGKLFTREREGSGIGLSLVKSLVELHGGNITAESVEEQGSTFVIVLPVIRLDGNHQEISADGPSNEGNTIERIHIEFSDIYS